MRVLTATTPAQQAELDQPYRQLGSAAVLLAQRLGNKQASDASTVHALAGKLYLSRSGWLLLAVPNSLVRGAFDALNAPGAELPLNDAGMLTAHISVMRKDEVAQIGADKITERGHNFAYTLGPIKEVVPHGWAEMGKVWFIEIQSPELKALRKSYGLSPLPNETFQFHITIAVRRKKVLQHNDVSKAAAWLQSVLQGCA